MPINETAFMADTNADVIRQYQDHKKKTDALAAAAREAMQLKYVQLLEEAAEIFSAFHEFFGVDPQLPAMVSSFVLESGDQPSVQTEAQSKGKKIGGLRRSYSAAIKRGDLSKARAIAGQLQEMGVEVAVVPIGLDLPEEHIDTVRPADTEAQK